MDKRVIATLSECMDQIIQLSSSRSGTEPNAAGTSSAVAPTVQPAVSDSEMEVVDDRSAAAAPGKDVSLIPEKLVIFIAATNKAENLDPVIRGRFANEIVIPVPDGNARTRILQHFCKQVNYDREDVCFHTLGQTTAGYVGSDLKALMEQSCLVAIKRIIKNAGGESVLLSQLYNRDIKSIFDLDCSVWSGSAAQNGIRRSVSTLSLDSGVSPLPSAAAALTEPGRGVPVLSSSNCKLYMSDFLVAMKCKFHCNAVF